MKWPLTNTVSVDNAVIRVQTVLLDYALSVAGHSAGILIEEDTTQVILYNPATCIS